MDVCIELVGKLLHDKRCIADDYAVASVPCLLLCLRWSCVLHYGDHARTMTIQCATVLQSRADYLGMLPSVREGRPEDSVQFGRR